MPLVAVKPDEVNLPASWLAMTKPTSPVDGKYIPEFKSPENLMDGTAKLPFPTVKLVIVLAEPEAAL
jgi:hypothetical protein